MSRIIKNTSVSYRALVRVTYLVDVFSSDQTRLLSPMGKVVINSYGPYNSASVAKAAGTRETAWLKRANRRREEHGLPPMYDIHVSIQRAETKWVDV